MQFRNKFKVRGILFFQDRHMFKVQADSAKIIL
jgi:hypothetical protein